MRSRSLDGITVVTVEQAVSAPFATRQLADLGARVVKVERPDGGDFARSYDQTVEGLSSAFVWANRGKRSIAVDIKTPLGAEVLERLLASADVFVHNLSPAAARRAGLDVAAVSERHPEVIPCAVAGYAADGPCWDARAYDMLIQGEAGIISVTGQGDDMAKVGISIADIAASMYAVTGILSSLWHRERTGEILPVEVSMFDSLVEWEGYPLFYAAYGGTHPARIGTSHPTIAPYGAFVTADGIPVLIAVQNDREWERLCTEFLDRPELLHDARFADMSLRVANRVALDEVIADRFARRSHADILEALQDAGIAHSRIRDLHEVSRHPELTDRGRWIPTGTPVGEIRTLVPPTMTAPEEGFGRVPALGEDTEEVLAGLGYGQDEIDDLLQAQAILGREPR